MVFALFLEYLKSIVINTLPCARCDFFAFVAVDF